MLSFIATVVVDENDIVSGKFLIFIQKLDHKQQKKNCYERARFRYALDFNDNK